MAAQQELRRGSLPSLTDLDLIKSKPEHSPHKMSPKFNMSMPAPPLPSPSNIYSGPPPPYSYPSSTASSVVDAPQTPSTSLPPPPPLRSIEPQNGDRPISSSLPPINPASLKIQSILSDTPSFQPQSFESTAHSSSHLPPMSIVPQGNHAHPHKKQAQAPDSRAPLTSSPSAPVSQDLYARPCVTASFAPYANRQATHSTEQHQPTPHYTSQQAGHAHIAAHSSYSAQPPSSPSTLPPPPDIASHSSQQRQPPMPTYVTARPQSTYSYPMPPPTNQHQSVGQTLDRPRLPSMATSSKHSYESHVSASPMTKITRSPDRPAYGESVKRQLDIFDLETSLNEIAEGSGRVLEFSRRYGVQAHQTARSGPMPGSLPTVPECDDIVRMQYSVLDSIMKLRDVVAKQDFIQAEQRKHSNALNAGSRVGEHETQSANSGEPSHKPPYPSPAPSLGGMSPGFGRFSNTSPTFGSGGFAGADAKKRRGRAAPPGCCHSCKRAETPEWRRGPDGARTLCNACGLHYAKLTRKMGNTKPTSSSLTHEEESKAVTP